MKRLILPALLLAALPASAHAASGSLTYAKDGDIYVSAPDGSRAARLTVDGGYAWPSQADDGTILTVRQTAEGGRTPRRLHRLRRDGTRIGAPVETVRVDNSYYIGPLAPKISPDGTMVAYHYFYTGPLSDRTRPVVAFSGLDTGSEPGVFANSLGSYLTPSWTADGRVLVFLAAQRTSHVGVHAPHGDYTDWFGDPAVETLLTDGELTTAGDKLVAVGEQNDLRFYDAATTQLRCVMTGFNGDVSDPTWSPDGTQLAWEEADGVHVAAVGDLASCAGAARPLVVPGGQDPDWGPAAPPAVPGTPSPTPPTTTPAPAGEGLRLTLARWRGSVRKRPAITVRCSAACSVSAKLTLTTKTARRLKVPRTLATARAPRAGTMRFKVSRKVKRAEATLTVTATAGGQTVTRTRRVRLTR
jgi:hypothetical protein